MNYITKRSLSGLLAASIVGFSGCGGSTPEELQTTGYLSLGVSDGPIHNADAVCISFDEVELHSSGNSTIISVDEKVDLLNFQGTDVAPLVQTAEVEAGNYQWLRLGIDADQIGAGGADCLGDGSYIVINGESYKFRSLKNLPQFRIGDVGFLRYEISRCMSCSSYAPRCHHII